MWFLAPFIRPILAGLFWLGRNAFTGATGVAVGTAIGIGLTRLLARMGVGIISYGIIYAVTAPLMAMVYSGADPDVAQLLGYTGMATAINIILSGIQGVLAIRVIKLGFVKV